MMCTALEIVAGLGEKESGTVIKKIYVECHKIKYIDYLIIRFIVTYCRHKKIIMIFH